jgi:hypothetical protein
MAVERENVPAGADVPEDFNGFALEQTICEHGCPHVLLLVYKDGAVLVGRMMDPEELVTTAQGMVDAAAMCESARQLQRYHLGEI